MNSPRLKSLFPTITLRWAVHIFLLDLKDRNQLPQFKARTVCSRSIIAKCFMDASIARHKQQCGWSEQLFGVHLLLLNKAYIYKLCVCHCHVLLILTPGQELDHWWSWRNDLLLRGGALAEISVQCPLFDKMHFLSGRLLILLWKFDFHSLDKGQWNICMLERLLGHWRSLFWFLWRCYWTHKSLIAEEFERNKKIQALLSVPLLFFLELCRNGFPSGGTALEAIILIGWWSQGTVTRVPFRVSRFTIIISGKYMSYICLACDTCNECTWSIYTWVLYTFFFFTFTSNLGSVIFID